MKRLRSVFFRLYTVLTKLSSAVLQVWKTFPEPVRTAVLVFAVGSAMLWNKQPPQIQSGTEGKAETVHISKEINDSKAELRSATLDRPRAPLNQVSKTKPNRTTTSPPTVSSNSTDAVARAREASGYENYGEAYRQFRSATETLPDAQKQAFAHELQESAQKHKQGDYREATLQLERIFASRPSINQ